MAAQHVSFSVIVPTYNSEALLPRAIQSVLAQTIAPSAYEIVVVDDASTDRTVPAAQELSAKHKNIKVLTLKRNAGPGLARNEGVRVARGEWILFLDSDDFLHPDALAALQAHLAGPVGTGSDAVGYDWNYDPKQAAEHFSAHAGRKDLSLLDLPKSQLVDKYLALRMDGSVIYTAVKRSLLIDHDLAFTAGLHEDVDYIFKIYWHARKISRIDDVLYYKCSRKGSIVNTMSEAHLRGFIRAWSAVGEYAAVHAPSEWSSHLPHYRQGIIGTVATRVREVVRRVPDMGERASLFSTLYQQWRECLAKFEPLTGALDRTQYQMIAGLFAKAMSSGDPIQSAKTISDYVAEVSRKTWSCVDLHHSAFLAPDEVRTCCKRFFVDGEMRGDVVLFKASKGAEVADLAQNILSSKQALLHKINADEKSDCEGCPFLEFKEWGPLNKLDLKYLSCEYHSVCNLKCTYCSDLYYGGVRAQYDIDSLISGFLRDGALKSCGTVVWGGGEPLADKQFESRLDLLVNSVPNAEHRVLSNGILYSPLVERFLREGRISMTSSIDAGTEETYKKVRGFGKLLEALSTLKRYATANASRVTLKYIFTELNSTVDEVEKFAKRIEEYGLQGCNIQISCDFKADGMSEEAFISMVVLYGLLNKLGSRLIFMDDLVRQRILSRWPSSEPKLRETLKRLHLEETLADGKKYKSVAIWGAGWIAKHLVEETSFFKQVEVEFFVDSRPSMVGKTFLGHKTVDPKTLSESGVPVVIAAVQGYPLIFDAFQRLGIDRKRLVDQLVL